MRNKIILLGLIAGILYGCSQSLYMPASSNAEVQAKLLSGRKIYVDHCGGCHNLHFPKEFTAEQWKVKIDEMAAKANVNDQEKQLILQYLTSQP